MTAVLSLLHGDPLGTVSEALVGALYGLAALGVEPSRRPGGRLLVWVVAVVALVLLSLYRHFFA